LLGAGGAEAGAAFLRNIAAGGEPASSTIAIRSTSLGAVGTFCSGFGRCSHLFLLNVWIASFLVISGLSFFEGLYRVLLYRGFLYIRSVLR